MREPEEEDFEGKRDGEGTRTSKTGERRCIGRRLVETSCAEEAGSTPRTSTVF